jgi:hypothetical protein
VGSRRIGAFGISGVPVIDVHELAALFGRAASRDLFDARELLAMASLEFDRGNARGASGFFAGLSLSERWICTSMELGVPGKCLSMLLSRSCILSADPEIQPS